MKLLIVGEGEHELGKGKAAHAGALEVLVGRMLGGGHEFESITVRHPELGRAHGKGDGMFKKAVACLRYAEREGYDGVVLVIDQDDDATRRRQLGQAQEHVTFAVRRAMGVAVKTFDAWVLADEVALGVAIGGAVATQPDPESLDDAKGRCRALRDGAGCTKSTSEVYAEALGAARLEVVEKRCADGFGVFARRVRGMGG